MDITPNTTLVETGVYQEKLISVLGARLTYASSFLDKNQVPLNDQILASLVFGLENLLLSLYKKGYLPDKIAIIH